MKLDIEVRAFAVDNDENLAAELKKCSDEGLVPLAGMPPVIVYHMVRMQQMPAAGAAGVGTLRIDDSKVHIIRAGDKTN